MITYCLRQNQLKANTACYKKWYARAVAEETVDLEGLSAHMASHNSPFSAGAIKGILTDMVACIKELLLDGKKVRIDNLAIFAVGIQNKKGCEDKSTYKVTEYVEAVKLKALAIGELAKSSLNLDATLKRSSLDKDATTSDEEGDDDGNGGDGATTSGGTSNSGGTTSGGTQNSGSTNQGHDDLEDAIG